MGKLALFEREVGSPDFQTTFTDSEFLSVNDISDISHNSLEQAPQYIGSIDTLVDRNEIEQQANELIAQKNSIELGYKSDETYNADARTLLFEALTASGHLSEVEITGTIEEIHAKMLSVVVNAYSLQLPAHEQRRRFQEICEELTKQKVELLKIAGLLPWEVKVGTISDFITEDAISKRSAESIGYRASNKKGMVRDDKLIDHGDGTYTRVSEQVSRSNAIAARSQEFLQQSGIPLRESPYADVSVLGTQFIHLTNIIDIQKRLDAHQGVNIRYGEVSSELQIPYELLKEQSSERERRAECFTEKLALFTMNLDEKLQMGWINKKQYETQFKSEIGNILRAICVMEPSYAVSCFGEEAEAGFIKASNLTAAGKYQAAEQVLIKNMEFEQTVSFCGMSLTVEEAQKMGLQVDSLEDLLKLGSEKYGNKRGACRVENCPRPSPTEIGGCAVCVGNNSCQELFDKGWSYNRIKKFYLGLKKSAKTIVKKAAGSAKKVKEKVVSKRQKYRNSKKHEKIKQ